MGGVAGGRKDDSVDALRSSQSSSYLLANAHAGFVRSAAEVGPLRKAYPMPLPVSGMGPLFGDLGEGLCDALSCDARQAEQAIRLPLSAPDRSLGRYLRHRLQSMKLAERSASVRNGLGRRTRAAPRTSGPSATCRTADTSNRRVGRFGNSPDARRARQIRALPT